LSNRACAVGAVLINTVSDANWAGHRLKLLTSNPLVRALRHRHLREDRRSLQPPSIPKKRLSNLVSGIRLRIDVRRVAHGVIGPLLLIERLNPQHVVKSQVSSGLNEPFSFSLAVNTGNLGEKTVLRRDTDNDRVICGDILLNLETLVHHLKALLTLVRINRREPNPTNEPLRKDRMDTLRDTGHLRDSACGGNRPLLHRDRNPKVVSVRLRRKVNGVRHHPNDLVNLIIIRSI